jgi:hypothetical protein
MWASMLELIRENRRRIPTNSSDKAQGPGAVDGTKLSGPGPVGAVVFFALAVVSARAIGPFLSVLGFSRLSAFVTGIPGCAQLVILPLAYLFYPQVYSKRFWRIPGNTWDWLFGIAVLEAVAWLLGNPLAPVSRRFALGIVLIGPLPEEIARAVLISPFLRWGKGWAIVIASFANIIVHPDPLGVVIPVVVQTVMFVSTDRSIPGTALGHAFMNACVVAAAGIEGW